MGELRAARWSETSPTTTIRRGLLVRTCRFCSSEPGHCQQSRQGFSVFKENLELDVLELISISISISGLQVAPPPTRSGSRSRFHALPDGFYVCVGIRRPDRDSNQIQIPEGRGSRSHPTYRRFPGKWECSPFPSCINPA